MLLRMNLNGLFVALALSLLKASKRQTLGREKYGMATFEAVSFALVYFKRLG